MSQTFHEMENDAMESLKEISDVSWYVDQRLDKLDNLMRSISVTKPQRRTLYSADGSQRRTNTALQKVRFVHTLDLDELVNKKVRHTTLGHHHCFFKGGSPHLEKEKEK